jgi:hypothetical protein
MEARVVSTEAILFTFLRWPWSLIGCVLAVRDRLAGRFVDFRITPKGEDATGPMPARVLLPYALISLGSALAALAFPSAGEAQGYYAFAILNAVIYGALPLIVILMHVRENGVVTGGVPLRYAAYATTVAGLMLMSASAVSLRGPQAVAGLAWGVPGAGEIVRPVYRVAGAGSGRDLREIRIDYGRVGEIIGLGNAGGNDRR